MRTRTRFVVVKVAKQRCALDLDAMLVAPFADREGAKIGVHYMASGLQSDWQWHYLTVGEMVGKQVTGVK